MSEYTPEQLRDWAKVEEEMGEQEGPVRAKLRQHVADQLRAHAAALEELAALKAELVSVKAGYMKLAKHAERISVCAENLEYEGGYVVSGVSELNEAVDAYRAAFKETP